MFYENASFAEGQISGNQFKFNFTFVSESLVECSTLNSIK